MDRSKITGIILVVALSIIIIGLIIVGIFVFGKKDETPQEEVKEQATIKSSTQAKTSGDLNLSSIDVSDKSSSKKKKMMEDYEIIGVIEIPKISLKSNILGETTKRSLEIAVAQIYTTGGLNQPGNTVIYGHNYRNTLFFSRNDELTVGDKIFITDESTGTKKEYHIFNIFETTSTDTSFYTRTGEQTLGKVEVTLSTCTDDASKTDRRLIVQAREE